MEYRLSKHDSIIIFFEDIVMLDSLDFPDLNLITYIIKSSQALMYGVLQRK